MGRDLKKGDRIQLATDVDLRPYTTLKKGEYGTILYTETDSSGVYLIDVRMDAHHAGLNLWQNVALLVEPELEAVVPVKGVKAAA